MNLPRPQGILRGQHDFEHWWAGMNSVFSQLAGRVAALEGSSQASTSAGSPTMSGGGGGGSTLPIPLPTTYGGTGLSAIGTPDQVLGVNHSGSTLIYKSVLGTAGNITSVGADGTITLNLATVGTAGTYGDAGHIPEITTDAYGRVTSVTLLAISVSGVTGILPLANGGTGANLGTPAQGSVPYINASNVFATLAPGSANQLFTSGGASANPSWQNVASLLTAGSNISISGTTNATIACNGAPPTGSAGGDLSGSYPNPAVARLQGTPVSSSAPVGGQLLDYSGSQWQPQYKGWLPPCRAATTANLTATYANGSSGVGATLTNSGAQAAIAIDGISLNLGDSLLVKNQASASQNGIYTVTTVGSGSSNWVLTRRYDFNQSSNVICGSSAMIEEGTVGAGQQWQLTTATAASTPTIGTTSLSFGQVSGSGTGAGTAVPPAWVSSVSYSAGNIVIGGDGNLYTCVTANSGNNPTSDSGTNWILFYVASNLTLNVQTSGGRFNGLVTGTNPVWSFLKTAIVPAGVVISIQVADGTYNFSSQQAFSHVYGAQINLTGNTTTPANCVLKFSAGVNGLNFQGGFGTVNGFTLDGTTATAGFNGIQMASAAPTSNANIGANMVIQNWDAGILAANGARCIVLGNIIIQKCNYGVSVNASFANLGNSHGITIGNSVNGSIQKVGIEATNGASILAPSATLNNGSTTPTGSVGVQADHMSYVFAPSNSVSGFATSLVPSANTVSAIENSLIRTS